MAGHADLITARMIEQRAKPLLSRNAVVSRLALPGGNRLMADEPRRSPSAYWSALGWRDEGDYLPVVSPVHCEIPPIHGEHLTACVQFAHHDDGRVREVHTRIASHQRPHARPVRRQGESDIEDPALEQLKQRIDVQLILAKEVHRLRQNRL